MFPQVQVEVITSETVVSPSKANPAPASTLSPQRYDVDRSAVHLDTASVSSAPCQVATSCQVRSPQLDFAAQVKSGYFKSRDRSAQLNSEGYLPGQVGSSLSFSFKARHELGPLLTSSQPARLLSLPGGQHVLGQVGSLSH